MTDVYNRTVFGRNSIKGIPDGYIESTSNNLFSFLGSFWRNIHEGRAFIKGLQHVRGIIAAQFYLDLIESLNLQNRNGIPVFHRELWKPLIIRYSKRNKAQENVLKIDGGAVIGPQEEGSKYGEGTELNIGTLANLENYVTYPVEGDIHTIVSGITNNIINPTVSYKVSQEFPGEGVIYVNGTIIFPKDKDPFLEGSGFEVYDVVDDVRDDSTTDRETVLWASDVLIDKKYISEHMSYALGISCDSSEVIKRIINAGWDALNCGLTPELLRTLLAALINAPVIQEPDERIIKIGKDDGGTTFVQTDKNKYTVFKDAKLRDCVAVGSIMHRGEMLDQSVKIYPVLTDVTEDKLKNTTEYADIFKQDVPVITLPRTILRTKTANGLSVDWTPTEILWRSGEYYVDKDKVEHRKLYFFIDGPEDDVENFWNDVWDSAAEKCIDLDELFTECEPSHEKDSSDSSSDSLSDDSWLIVPAEFFIRHLIGANTLIITVDRSQIEDSSLLRDQKFFNILNNVMPDSMRLFFIEHVEVGDEHDTYNTGGLNGPGEYATGVEEEVDKYIAKDVYDDFDDFSYSSLPGIKGKRMPTYEDQVEMKFFRNRKRNAD